MRPKEAGVVLVWLRLLDKVKLALTLFNRRAFILALPFLIQDSAVLTETHNAKGCDKETRDRLHGYKTET